MFRLLHRPALFAAVIFLAVPAQAQDVIVFGSIDEVVNWLEAEDWWGEELHSQQLRVPQAMITGIAPRWRTD